MLEGRVHRRHLLDGAEELGQSPNHLLPRDLDLRRPVGDPSLSVVGIGSHAQDDLSAVGLGRVHQVLDDPRRLSQADDQHPRGHGVQRPGVAHPSHT